MPWEKQCDRNEVLERAMDAFWLHGFEATSISELVDATGLSRGSLYNDFTDKHGLFVATLRHYDKVHRENFIQEVTDSHKPREAILAAFRQVIVCARNGEDRKGCLLVNTALEVSPGDPEIDEMVRKSLRHVEEFFKASFSAGQADGSIRSSLKPADAAKRLFSLFLGLRVITRSYPERSLMNTTLRQAEAVLDT